MYLKIFGVIFIVLLDICISDNVPKSKVLSRRKRYVAFPEGSSFSCAACMTIGVLGQPAPSTSPGTFTFGLNWGIAYELPNATETSKFYRKKNRHRKPMEQRRSRRELYEKLEIIMDKMGYDGRQCVLKTLCETTQRIVPHGENMIEEMFRTLFTMPMTKLLPIEPLEHKIYDAAHRLGVLLENCNVYKCPISLVDLALGYYNAPAPRVDTALNPWTLFSSSYS
ncbi:uncharacterized protein LOC115444161 [Manduca sexta]|uniref:Uncharacterized protein n=1 Tax=Manduca sexta TaxID=7130 RepID=A0A922CLX1_MANSE|nr:uncharacterized protein LOC115444161 [Manduca sexta]KAG6451057.1 hypothetical protein O3G_MSEX006897 [Manduca sexta]